MSWPTVLTVSPILLLLLSHFSHVRLCATPETAAHQAPPSLGFPRQEHWSGLPFPSPMYEKCKVKVKSLSLVRLLATPRTAAYQAPLSMGFSRQEYWSDVPLPSPVSHSNNLYFPLILSHVWKFFSTHVQTMTGKCFLIKAQKP